MTEDNPKDTDDSDSVEAGYSPASLFGAQNLRQVAGDGKTQEEVGEET